jgi:hypothetical protein
VAPRLPVLREDWPHHRTGVKFRTASSVHASLEEKTHSTSKSAVGYRFMNTRPSRSPLPRSSGVPAQDKTRGSLLRIRGGPRRGAHTVTILHRAMPRPTQPNSTGPRHAQYTWGWAGCFTSWSRPAALAAPGPRPRRLVPYGLHHSHPIDRKQHEPDQGGDAHGEQDLLMPLGHCDTVRRRSFS